MIAAEHRLALPAGYQLGKYRFKGLLGAGGFGITYLAEDHSLGRRVAIKELLPNDIATRLDGTTVIAKTQSEEGNLVWARERFVEEGRALAACEHPNVVHVYEMIEANGTAYMVTKYEEGRSMAEWLQNLGRPPTEAELRGVLEPLLSGLEKVHRTGFLHRDLKPENIYLTEDGRPLLLDFGSARQALTGRTAMLTSIVTIGYAPFEQYYEDGKQGPWSDIYALAAVMYRAIHGEKPPEATRRLKNDPCLNLSKTYAKNYSPQFLHALDRALAMEYADRPQSIAAWRAMLGHTVAPETDNLAVTPRETWHKRLQPALRLAQDHPRWSTAAGILIVGSVIWMLAPSRSALHSGPVTPAPMVATPAPIAAATPASLPPAASTPAPGPSVYDNPAPSAPFVMPLPTPGTATAATPVPHLKPSPWSNPTATPAPKSAPSDTTPAAVVDHKVIGTWTTKITNPSGYVTLHWVQKEDGHYSLTRAGEVIDTGTLSADQGQMHRISETTQQEADLTYEFKGTRQMTTTDPADSNGPMTWTRTSRERSGESSSSGHSSGNSEGSSHSSSGGGGSDWKRFIPRSIPRLPF